MELVCLAKEYRTILSSRMVGPDKAIDWLVLPLPFPFPFSFPPLLSETHFCR
jgi:hypothetical protein